MIWRTTSSFRRSLPSKRGARSRESIWQNSGGKIVNLSMGMSEIGNGFTLGLGLARMVTDLERRLGRVSCSGSVVEMGCLSFPTRLNRWVLLISWLRSVKEAKWSYWTTRWCWLLGVFGGDSFIDGISWIEITDVIGMNGWDLKLEKVIFNFNH